MPPVIIANKFAGPIFGVFREFLGIFILSLHNIAIFYENHHFYKYSHFKARFLMYLSEEGIEFREFRSEFTGGFKGKDLHAMC